MQSGTKIEDIVNAARTLEEVSNLVLEITKIRAEENPFPDDVLARLKKIPYDGWKQKVEYRAGDAFHILETTDKDVYIKIQSRGYGIGQEMTVEFKTSKDKTSLYHYNCKLTSDKPLCEFHRSVWQALYDSYQEKKTRLLDEFVQS